MARTYAQIPVSIWNDASFTGLSPAARQLYLFLLTQPELDAGGQLPLLPRRWNYISGVPLPEVEFALSQLREASWVSCDDEQQEAFVSGYFAAEDIGKQPRRVVAAQDAMTTWCSKRLAAIASLELSELIAKTPDPVPRGIRAEVLERDGYQCLKCGWKPGDPVPMKPGTNRPVFRILELDHIWPKSKGGLGVAENFQVLCTTCNCRKGARV